VSVATVRAAPIDEGNDPTSEALVDAGQTFHCYMQSSFFEDFPSNTVFERFVQFEHPARGLPLAVVLAPDHENAIIVPYDDAGDADRVFRRGCHH
jgi:hypothetical protein